MPRYSPSRVINDAVADAMAADIIPLLDNPLTSSLYDGVASSQNQTPFWDKD